MVIRVLLASLLLFIGSCGQKEPESAKIKVNLTNAVKATGIATKIQTAGRALHPPKLSEYSTTLKEITEYNSKKYSSVISVLSKEARTWADEVTLTNQTYDMLQYRKDKSGLSEQKILNLVYRAHQFEPYLNTSQVSLEMRAYVAYNELYINHICYHLFKNNSCLQRAEILASAVVELAEKGSANTEGWFIDNDYERNARFLASQLYLAIFDITKDKTGIKRAEAILNMAKSDFKNHLKDYPLFLYSE